jgi:hypothetical protein
MVILAATGYRRWLSRPWQWSLRDYLVAVAIWAAALVLSRYPTLVIIFFAIASGAIYISLSLARHGFRLADIATLLAMILLTAAIILPALERSRSRTPGTPVFRSFIPDRYITLFSGSR